MSAARMSLSEFAAEEGMSTLNVTNALRADSRLPKHERRYPFITAEPPVDCGGKWRYIIPRAQYEQYKAGQQVFALDYDALAEALAPRLLAHFAALAARQIAFRA